ncbi:MAG: hypothetical protein IJZ56_04610 [Oscillospiraceae bacterium]|nr:hypothetical protein [Oscillospiraceae bacterium]
MAQQLDVRYVNFYSAGSSALKVAPAIPLETLELPRRTKKKAKKLVLYVDPVAIAGIFMAAVMAVSLLVGFVQLSNARQEEIAMAAYVDSLQQQNQELTAEFEAAYDLEQVEEVALALGMVPQEQLQKVTVKTVEPAEKPEPNTWHNFWASIMDLFA